MGKIKVGITGQNGFVGTHLYNRVSLLKEEFKLIPFQNLIFDNNKVLMKWVSKCDVIIHLAAFNRHEDPQVIFNTNVSLVKKLINAVEKSGKFPHIIFSSSTQEDKDNLYGKSKKAGRQLLKEWGNKSNSIITGLIIPNVFGPFGKPFYNSVVATFCYQLCNGEKPEIDVNAPVNLIYIDDLVSEIITAIRNGTSDTELYLRESSEIFVADILSKLFKFKTDYLDNGIFPDLRDEFSKNLFNTFRSYINPAEHFPVFLKKNTDVRGTFVETIKLNQGGQISFSTTVKNITRGNHFHTRKIERFAVIKGKAHIQLRKYNTEEVLDFTLDGTQPSYVDMPVWYTHNIKNIGEEDLYTIFWINEFYDEQDPDTFYETV